MAWVLLMMLLHRTTNLPLLALISVAESLLSKCHLASNVSIHMYYWLGLASYFYQVIIFYYFKYIWILYVFF